ncbi:hypothetical protein BJY16_006849 [Actinoplanes octamycinicus]|uniref:PIN domain-containing protein n=1 Tax=Actinoplanes octamycinicus TaxID=135948 RepID=A0A7W7H3M0_9ACTN|nr:hypothetical protein [Actinoplanes octamycinicus]MBB4743390.1 hypothetical protein [Actinoplanes octamycinicus]GIE61906.1 hypothetical protein Aoc01nite_73080 [Actinoplanes octamycinicus]
MITLDSTLVLDASALVELMQGHPTLTELLDRGYEGDVIMAVPPLAVLEAQVAIQTDPALWDHVLRFPGLQELDLSARCAALIGDLAAPRLERNPLHTTLMAEQMAAEVVYEAIRMRAAVLTRFPNLYRGYAVTVAAV